MNRANFFTSYKTIVLGFVLAMSVFVALLLPGGQAAAAACTVPSTDYGTVNGLSVTADTAGTYRIWTRMAAATQRIIHIY